MEEIGIAYAMCTVMEDLGNRFGISFLVFNRCLYCNNFVPDIVGHFSRYKFEFKFITLSEINSFY